MGAIEAVGLRRSYGDNEAVRGLDLHVETGEVVAVLGPNGAGKTTTIEILEGHRTRDGGTVSVLGFDPDDGGRALRSRIGIVLQESAFDPFLTVAETLRMFGELYPAPLAVDEVLDVVGLADKAGDRVSTLSGGQVRRLDVGVGLVGDPDLLFLDEPTTGFDPSARRQAWAAVQNLRSLGKTILLTTHYMDEAQHLADRVVVVAGGVVVAEGTPDDLGGRATRTARIECQLPGGTAAASLPIPPTHLAGATARWEVDDPTRALHTITGWALAQGIALEGLQVVHPSLEDVYLELVAAHAPAEAAAAP